MSSIENRNTWLKRAPRRLPLTPNIRTAIVLALLISIAFTREIFAQGGPPGATVWSIAVSPSDPATLYVATNNGVYKSIDSAATWTRTSLTALSTTRTVYSIAIDPANPSVLYAGTSDGVMKTTNAGTDWNLVLYLNTTYSLALDPANSAIVYAGTASGIRKSINSGVDWTSTSLPGSPGNAYSILVSPFDSSEVLAASALAGVFRSTNGGANWALSNSGITVSDVRRLAMDPTNPLIVYAGSYGAGVFKSVDGGTNWLPANSGYLGTFVNDLVFDPSNPTVLYSASNTILVTTDGGASWSALSPSAPPGSANRLAMHALAPGTIYAGSTKGVFRLTGGSWTYASSGLTDLGVTALLLDPAIPSTIHAATTDGAFKSTNGGISWTRGDTAMYSTGIAIDAANRNLLYLSGFEGVLKTTDGGSHWISANSGLPQDAVMAIAVDPANPITLYAGTEDNGIYKTTNGGTNWVSSSSGLSGLRIRALAIHPSNPSVVYAGAENVGLFKSVDGGANWTAASSGLTGLFGSGTISVRAIAIDPSNPATLYAGLFSSGTFKSTDAGSTWTPIGGLGTTSVIAIDPVTPSNVYIAGTNPMTPLLRSTTGGGNWSLYPFSLGSPVTAMVVDPLSSTLYFGTSQDGVYKLADWASGGTPTKAFLGSGAPPAVSISKVHGDGQRGAFGAPLRYPFVVVVTNQAGVPVSGVSLTFTVNSGNGTLSLMQALTDSQGIASSVLTFGNTPGTIIVSVAAAGLAGSPVTFTASGPRRVVSQITSQ